MKRKPIIAANWKMNKGPSDTEAYLEDFTPKVDDISQDCDIVVAPPFSSLFKAHHQLNVALAAQNVSQYDNGAYTGEVSAMMLKELFVRYVIIGHSERRTLFGETDEIINAKIKQALANGLKVIFCIGETFEEREAGKIETVLHPQIKKGLKGVSEEDASEVVVAYEPVWAIGTGKTATPEQAQDAHAFVRSVLAHEYNQKIADQIRIQYGGSANPENAAKLMAKDDIDGFLVGTAGLDPQSFLQIILNALAMS